jgi:hypothetical protein
MALGFLKKLFGTKSTPPLKKPSAHPLVLSMREERRKAEELQAKRATEKRARRGF